MVGMERKLSLKLAEALDQATLRVIRSPEMSPNQILSEFDGVESNFLPEVSSNSDWLLELRRRTEERKLSAFMDRDLPYDEVAPLLKRLRELGFSTFEIRANYEIVFAKYCQRQGRKNESKEILLNLLDHINGVLKEKNLTYYREVKQKIELMMQS